jgi:hypothetical protein
VTRPQERLQEVLHLVELPHSAPELGPAIVTWLGDAAEPGDIGPDGAAGFSL